MQVCASAFMCLANFAGLAPRTVVDRAHIAYFGELDLSLASSRACWRVSRVGSPSRGPTTTASYPRCVRPLLAGNGAHVDSAFVCRMCSPFGKRKST
jgi:hypothetical protein